MFVLTKLVAILGGPSGLVYVGNFQNFAEVANTIARGGLNNGIIKYLSEYQDDFPRQLKLLETAAIISFWSAIVSAILLLCFSEFAADLVFDDISMSYVITVLAVTILFSVFNQAFLSALNGLKLYQQWLKFNLISSTVMLGYSLILLYIFGIVGVYLALASFQVIVFIGFVLSGGLKCLDYKMKFPGSYDSREASNLFRFTQMTLVSSIAFPLSLFYIRQHLTDTVGLTDAGYWQAMYSISSILLLIITSTVSVYYLPTLSEKKTVSEITDEIYQTLKLVVPIVSLAMIIFYFAREIIIWLIFTEEFSAMENLFLPQLIGDFLRVICFIFGYVLIARGINYFFVVKEIFISLTFIISSIVLISQFGLLGVTYSYIGTYIANLILLLTFHHFYLSRHV